MKYLPKITKETIDSQFSNILKEVGRGSFYGNNLVSELEETQPEVYEKLQDFSSKVGESNYARGLILGFSMMNKLYQQQHEADKLKEDLE